MALRQWFEELPSTQLLAVERARAGEPHGTRVVAGTQSSGRGRLDHTWASPAGGLYMSVILEDTTPSGPALSLAIGAALQSTLFRRHSVPAQLRWPNDLVLVGPTGAERKLGGVLVDALVGRGGPRVVVGVGLNVRADPLTYPPGLRGRYAELSEFARPPPPLEELEVLVAEDIERVHRDLATADGRARWIGRGREILFGRGRLARIDSVLVGRIRDLGEDGALWVDGDSGAVAYHAGTLELEAAG